MNAKQGDIFSEKIRFQPELLLETERVVYNEIMISASLKNACTYYVYNGLFNGWFGMECTVLLKKIKFRLLSAKMDTRLFSL